MHNRLAQLGAIIRYELKMHWRKGGLTAFLVVLTLAVVAINLRASDRTSEPLPEQILSAIPSMRHARVATGAVLVLMIVVGVPLLVAEVIPHDRHIGVRELLDSLPLTPFTYLVGKIAGVWVFMLAGLGGVLTAYALLEFRLVGRFDPQSYQRTWLLTVTPAMLFMITVGMLASADQPTRRQGLFAGLKVVTFILLLIPVARVVIGLYFIWGLATGRLITE